MSILGKPLKSLLESGSQRIFLFTTVTDSLFTSFYSSVLQIFLGEVKGWRYKRLEGREKLSRCLKCRGEGAPIGSNTMAPRLWRRRRPSDRSTRLEDSIGRGVRRVIKIGLITKWKFHHTVLPYMQLNNVIHTTTHGLRFLFRSGDLPYGG